MQRALFGPVLCGSLDAIAKLSFVLLAFGGAPVWLFLGPPWQPSLPPPSSRSLLLTGGAMGSGQREPCFVRRSTPVLSSFPLLPAAEGHKKNRVGFSPSEMMRSKCFLGSSLFLFWLVLFYLISLLPPLSRKPLLPHLRAICFTRRAPGEKSKKQTQRQLAGAGAGAWEIPRRRGCCWTAAPGPRCRGGRAGSGGGAMPSARARGGEKGGLGGAGGWRSLPPSCYSKA